MKRVLIILSMLGAITPAWGAEKLINTTHAKIKQPIATAGEGGEIANAGKLRNPGDDKARTAQGKKPIPFERPAQH